jgi:hypothetical protein
LAAELYRTPKKYVDRPEIRQRKEKNSKYIAYKEKGLAWFGYISSFSCTSWQKVLYQNLP